MTKVGNAFTIHVVRTTSGWLVSYIGRCTANNSFAINVADANHEAHPLDFFPEEF